MTRLERCIWIFHLITHWKSSLFPCFNLHSTFEIICVNWCSGPCACFMEFIESNHYTSQHIEIQYFFELVEYETVTLEKRKIIQFHTGSSATKWHKKSGAVHKRRHQSRARGWFLVLLKVTLTFKIATKHKLISAE